MKALLNIEDDAKKATKEGQPTYHAELSRICRKLCYRGFDRLV
jgi:hypothetical protein